MRDYGTDFMLSVLLSMVQFEVEFVDPDLPRFADALPTLLGEGKPVL